MSRPDLYDLAIDNGGQELIPQELCRARRIGIDRVWAVLTFRLLYADSNSVNFTAAQTVADRIGRGYDRTVVRRADQILEDCGLMRRDGREGRAIRYSMLPAQRAALPENVPEAPPDVVRDVVRNVGRDVGRDVGRIRTTKRKVKVSQSPRASADSATNAPPDPQTVSDDELNERDALARWLDGISQGTGRTISPTNRTLAVARRAITLGWTNPADALDELARSGHNLVAMKSGAVVTALETIGANMRKELEAWRANLPDECPHERAQELGLLPSQCADCRRAAGEQKRSVLSLLEGRAS